jgi:23S rRNA U2552 (ribose-2'-O)-methylase RlmE/FtsJ
MIYFLLPHNYSLIYKYLTLIVKPIGATTTTTISTTKADLHVDATEDLEISQSLYDFLLKIKEKMVPAQWDIYKKYTNPYEFIHTNIPPTKRCVSKLRPLSRSYFKMIEIFHTFRLPFNSWNPDTDKFANMVEDCVKPGIPEFKTPIRSFHLAEGPGGFIEALLHMRNCMGDVYHGMTLQGLDDDVPGWKKSQQFLKRHAQQVKIENGADGTGNILSLDNFVYIHETYGASMDFVSADGGFDFTENFNDQESMMHRLLFAQIAFALCLQKQGGHFVLKIFDIFRHATVELLYLLSSFYQRVYITKPDTSRHANSEKYVVCIHFIPPTTHYFFPFLHHTFKMMMDAPPGCEISHFLSRPVSYYFTTKLEEYNCSFGQQQIENIHYTLSLIETRGEDERNARIQELIRSNVAKCEQWCCKNNVPHDTRRTQNHYSF